MLTPSDVLEVNIISIIISVLLIIIIRVWLRVIVKMCEEVFDRDYRKNYKSTKDYCIKAIIITSITLFIILVLCVYYEIF